MITSERLFNIKNLSTKIKIQKKLKRKYSNSSYADLVIKDKNTYQWKGMDLPGRSIYLDGQATTPLDPRVLDKMLPYMTEQFGNPHSRTHLYGWETDHAVEKAREQVATLIGADPKEIIFTSGATESNNIAIKGVSKFYKKKKKHIITSVLEHKCVLDSCRNLEQEGFEVSYLPVHQNGLIDLNLLERKLIERPDTSLVSIMAVNNEIGVIQPLKKIGELCRKYGAFFHTDAAQGVGKIKIDVEDINVDLLSISGHKVYGPKGVGALYVRRRPRVKLEALFSGGGQERGIRSGTVPAPLVIGLGAACDVAKNEMPNDQAHARKLFDLFYNRITSELEEVFLNGDMDARWHGNINMSFAYVEGESLLMAIREVACSSGSACTSASLEPSYVLRALGVDEELAHTSIRMGFDRFTSEEEVYYATEKLIKSVKRLRNLSPLYHLAKSGVDLKTIDWSAH
jgi:cysteine desulfurase